MAQPRPRTRETLARNLRVLMDRAEWSQRDLAAQSKVSQRQISNILSMTTSCSVETAEALAKPFGLQGWHLVLPNLPVDLVQSTSIARLVSAYIAAQGPSRAFMDSLADRELSDGTNHKQKR